MSAQVLIIEDNATNMDLMTYLLGSLGFEVSCAADGTVGLRLAQEHRFDLILADILMPEMDGFQLAKRLKSDQALRGTPLIAVTALAMAGDRDKILDAGFDGYISKPIEPSEFLTQIRSFIKSANSGDRPYR